jgi:riboflavin kinase
MALSSVKTVCIKGNVYSGKGEGTRFMQLPWVKAQITEKLDFVPLSGTLNIKLTEDSVEVRKQLDIVKAIEILPADGFCRGKCFKAYLMGNVKCAVVVPKIEGYPQEAVEIAAPINLRKKLQLKDGDVVYVKIFL